MREKVLFSANRYEELRKIVRSGQKNLVFSFMNANDIYEIHNNEQFKDTIFDKRMNRIILIDGFTTAVVLSIKNMRILRRLQGPTFTSKFLNDPELVENKKHFFFGIGSGGLDRLCQRYPLLKRENVFGVQHLFIEGYHFSNELIKKVILEINKNKINYLWIGAGCPRQEILTKDLYDHIAVDGIFNVGVALEYIQGKRKRASKIFQTLGLEWFYRLFDDFKLTRTRIRKSVVGTFLAFLAIDTRSEESLGSTSAI
ncbi:MAG TPA: WecB/TagA/CpsF family glycosyltransferase [Candidatus Nanoarchaeia archaeon]|nr:WecB/TagA/CpsF family glycosyltransferase [Candidatus Nanoarchaeia archaeon]